MMGFIYFFQFNVLCFKFVYNIYIYFFVSVTGSQSPAPPAGRNGSP